MIERRGDPGAGEPRVSVIITAHSRSEFIRSAVSSVLDQTVDPSRYEVLLVKNFDEPTLDDWLAGHGVRVLRTDAGPLGAKIAVGIRASRGRVLAFLEDDDRFSPSKLEAVLSAFAQDPSLVFLHNRFRYVDEAGQPLAGPAGNPRALRRTASGGTSVISGERTGRSLSRLASQHPDFNCSSIAVSRDLALRAVPLLDRVHFAVDTLLFFVGLASTGALVVDERVLTDYRIHSKNLSMASGADLEVLAANKRAHGELIAGDYAVIRELAHETGAPAVRASGDALVLVQRIYDRLRNPTAQRAAMLRDLLAVPRLQSTYVVRTNLPVILGSALYVVAPGTARRRYLRAAALDSVDGSN